MGVIRGGLLVITCVLFFIALLLANSFFVVSESLGYDNLHEEVIPVISDVIDGEYKLSETIEAVKPAIEKYCENNSEYFLGGADNSGFKIDCAIIESGLEIIVKNSAENFIDDIYYKDYDCGFIECFTKSNRKPFFLISEKTQKYFEGKFYLVCFILVILFVLLFFLIENKTNLPFLAGSLMIVSSLPFMKLQYIFRFFAKGTTLKILNAFFVQSYTVFFKVFVLGVVFIIIGVVLKFFKVGFWFSNLISKFKGNETSLKKETEVSNKVNSQKVMNKDISKSKNSKVK